MKLIKLFLIFNIIILTSCYKYIEFKPNGYQIIEVTDTLCLDPIHYHYTSDSLNHCLFIDEFKHPLKRIYIIENYKKVKKYTIIKYNEKRRKLNG
jgi:hypothetical protein